jgi:hypothetical protein
MNMLIHWVDTSFQGGYQLKPHQAKLRKPPQHDSSTARILIQAFMDDLALVSRNVNDAQELLTRTHTFSS